jgi:hypothetical protein
VRVRQDETVKIQRRCEEPAGISFTKRGSAPHLRID